MIRGAILAITHLVVTLHNDPAHFAVLALSVHVVCAEHMPLLALSSDVMEAISQPTILCPSLILLSQWSAHAFQEPTALVNVSEASLQHCWKCRFAHVAF